MSPAFRAALGGGTLLWIPSARAFCPLTQGLPSPIRARPVNPPAAVWQRDPEKGFAGVPLA